MLHSLYNDATVVYQNWLKHADPRVADWPLMSSPLLQTVILAAYVYFVKRLGPRLMEKREPFKLQGALVIYNAAMVVFSIYLCYEFLMSGWATGYTFRCDLVDFSNSPKAVRMAWTCWLFYFSKFIELLDTVFFVLRKRNAQVTFLHVYHHTIMPWTWWFGVKFAPGGLGSFHGMVNSFVHVIMYSYYGLAAAGPAYQKYIWWKKYMTVIQLVQFVLVQAHIAQFFFLKDCPYNFTIFLYIIFIYGLVFLILFLHFWYQAYTKGQRPPKKLEHDDDNNHHVTNGNVVANGQANGKHKAQ